MKKFYLVGTEEEVEFGDVVIVPLVKELEDGRKIIKEKEFKLTEDTLQDAIDLGIIEESEEDELLDFSDMSVEEIISDHEQLIGHIVDNIEEIDEKVSKLESDIEVLKTLIKDKKSNGKKVNVK